MSQSWRPSQADYREQLLDTYDTAGVTQYESWIQQLTDEDHRACLEDIHAYLPADGERNVLDVGAGTGAMCSVLGLVPELSLTALEPCPEMARVLKHKHAPNVDIKVGFTDAAEDLENFPSQSFDVIVARQLMNGLYDPLTAIENWRTWLRVSGTLLILEGLYSREAWSGDLEPQVDQLPLSACQSRACIPYLLERAGFEVLHVGAMAHTNLRPSTRTSRYLVVARPVDRTRV